MKVFKMPILIIIAALIFSCTKKEEPKFTGPMQKITIGIQTSIITAPIIIAQKKGFFKDNGLDVTIKIYNTGTLALKGMLGDECDLSACADMPLVGTFVKGGYMLITSIASADNAAWMIARKDKGIITPKDLEGKKIATVKNSAVHYFLHAFLLHNFIREKVTVVYMEAAEMPKALEDGIIDAFTCRNPYIAEAKNMIGEENLVEFFAPEVYSQFFNVSGNTKFINENKDAVEKFVLSLSQAVDYIHSDKNGTLKILTEHFGIERRDNIVKEFDDFNYAIGLSKALLLTFENEAKMLMHESDQMTDIPDFLEIFYFDAVKKVKPESISIIGYRNED